MRRKKFWFLLIYDIGDDRRLNKLRRFIQKKAMRVQYSVYIYYGSMCDWNSFLNQLTQRIRKNEDMLFAYRLTTGAELKMYGKPLFPQGMHWLSSFPFKDLHHGITAEGL